MVRETSSDFIRIDINQGKTRKIISACQNETVNRTIHFLVVNNGVPIDLSNLFYAEILIHRVDGTETDNPCIIDGDDISYTLRSNDISVVGENEGHIYLTFKDGTTLETPVFYLNVFNTLYNPAALQSQNEYNTIVQQALNATNSATAAATSAAAAANSADAAEDSKDAAEASATAAATSATAAANSATAADNSCEDAARLVEISVSYADAAEDAKDAALNYKNAAETAATTATTKAIEASESATSAASSSSTATTQATSAASSATAAASSASTASDKADIATAQAQLASDKADAAAEAAQTATAGGLELGETANTAFRGDHGKIAYDHSQTSGNPHNTTAAQVGADVYGSAAAAYTQAAGYIDQQIAALINGAPQTLDTLKEIADAMAQYQDVVIALQAAIGSKAAEVDFSNHANNSTIHITAAERTKWDGITDLAARVTTLESMIGYPINPNISNE